MTEVTEAYEYSNFRLDDHNKFAGGGIVESFSELVGAIKQDGKNDAAQIAVAGVTVGLDVLGMVLDPLGTVLAAGIGWLIEHIGFLREPLDLLMGDPDAIKANAALLQMEAAKFKQYATEHDQALAAVAGWQGEAADKFRKSMQDLSEELLSYGEVVSGASDTTVNMGVAVAATRALVRDIIATLIGGLVAGALAAVAAAFFTFGASIAGFIATAIGLAASTAAKIAKLISKLTGIVGRMSKRMADLSQYMADVAKRMDRFADAARRNPWRPGGSWKNPSDDLANLPPFKTSPSSAPPPPKRSNTDPLSNTPDGPKPPQRADTMPNMPPPKAVPESSWAAWTKGGYRNQDQLMRPINELNRLPQQAIADLARKLFGNKHSNEVLHALETAKNVREPGFMVTVGGTQIPLGAFGASFSQMANEATKADDGREDAREAADT